MTFSSVARFIVMSGWIATTAVCLSIIGLDCWLAITARPASEDLSKLAFMAAGFLFSTFPTLLRDILFNREDPKT